MTDTTETLKTPENSAADAGTTVCRKCQAWWGGLKTCHCATCHCTFTTVTGFDLHRRGSYEPDNRHCVDSVTAGLVDAGRVYPCWGRPQNRDDDWRSALR
jgi:hypothetical protein